MTVDLPVARVRRFIYKKAVVSRGVKTTWPLT